MSLDGGDCKGDEEGMWVLGGIDEASVSVFEGTDVSGKAVAAVSISIKSVTAFTAEEELLIGDSVTFKLSADECDVSVGKGAVSSLSNNASVFSDGTLADSILSGGNSCDCVSLIVSLVGLAISMASKGRGVAGEDSDGGVSTLEPAEEEEEVEEAGKGEDDEDDQPSSEIYEKIPERIK